MRPGPRPLVQTGIAAEALTVMRDLSVVAAIEPRCRQVPFRMAVPADTTSVREGSWAAEGVPIPVSAQTFATVPGLDALKAGVIVTLTRELITFGVPSTEAIVRKAAIGGLSALLDFSFLDPASAAAAGRPASITNGATAVTQTGVTAATIGADLAALLAAITTAGSGLTWIMQRKTLANIASALPLNVSGNTLNGLPVITSDTSPRQITLGGCVEDRDRGRRRVRHLDGQERLPPDGFGADESAGRGDGLHLALSDQHRRGADHSHDQLGARGDRRGELHGDHVLSLDHSTRCPGLLPRGGRVFSGAR